MSANKIKLNIESLQNKIKTFPERIFFETLSIRSAVFLVIFVFANLQPFVVKGENLFKNGSLEEKPISQDWMISIGSKAKQCKAGLSSNAFEGNYSLKLTLDGPKADTDVWAGQKIEVIPGSDLSFKVYAKGTPGRSCYVQFQPVVEGHSLDTTYKSRYIPLSPLTENWSPLSATYAVSPEVRHVNVFIHMFRCDYTEAYFDKWELTVTANTLVNQRIMLRVNPLLGGCIDSFIDRDDNFDYTNVRRPDNCGGLLVDILPADDYPGLLANSVYNSKVIVPKKKIEVSRTIYAGDLHGLKVSKIYTLPSEDKPTVKIMVDFKNESTNTLSFVYRIQNVINSEDGVFSYPSRDWLTAFNKSPESIRTINSLIVDDLRAGWGAKKYKTHKVLLFEFDNQAVNKVYNYFLTKTFDTLEWYYRKVSLKPDEHWRTECSITLTLPEGELYTGGIEYKTPPVYIEGIKLPPLNKEKKPLPAVMQGYFPYGAALGRIMLPESTGTRDGRRLEYLYAYQRQIRELADNYFNNFFCGHMCWKSVNIIEPVGDAARLYNMTMTPQIGIVFKDNVEVETYRTNMLARLKSSYNTESLRQSINKYKDVILCYYTGDEPGVKNINCMLLGHETLRRELDPKGAFFPYICLAANFYEVARYLPVFLADFYPIYGSETLLRNPWAVTDAIIKAQRELPHIPIWLMAQGFGTFNNIYRMPTDPEMRLMLYSAVAAGAKGIIIYGLNASSTWLIKGGGEEIPILTAEGARRPQWQVLRDCGREITAIGPRLFYTSPEYNYSEVKISCANISKKSLKTKVYEGPALTINSLKHNNSKIRYLVVINQDDSATQKGLLSFSGATHKLSCYDLTRMKLVNTKENLNISLLSGDARFFILGSQIDIDPEIEDIFTNRYKREKVRYMIASERARKNGIETDPAPIGSGKSAYKAVIAAQHKLQETLDNTQFGKMLEQREMARERLSEIDFILKKNLDLVVPPSIRAATPNYGRYPKPADPKLCLLLKRIKQDFFDYWKYDRIIEDGKYNDNQKEIQELLERISVDADETRRHF